MINKNLSKKSGFTLIETFIAITILIVAVAGPLTVAQRALSSSQYSQDRVIGYYLAQDGIEYIRSVRDNLALSGDDSSASGSSNWIGYGSGNSINDCFTASGCSIDYSKLQVTPPLIQNNVIQACSSTCPVLNVDNSGATPSYTYDYGTGEQPTGFTRTVKMTLLNANEAFLTVTVSWQTTIIGQGNSVTLTEDLFNIH